MKSKNLYVLSGVPGCGKSTWASNFPNSYWISRDAIQYAILDYHNEINYFAYENTVFDIYVNLIQIAINEEKSNIIADATQLNSASRDKLLSRLNLRNYRVFVVYFDVPLETCLERNSQRTGREKVPERVIKKMYTSLRMISEEEINKGYELVIVSE